MSAPWRGRHIITRNNTPTQPDITISAADAAIGYLERGWVVFPIRPLERTGPPRCTCPKPDCPSGGKHPLPPHWNLDGLFTGMGRGLDVAKVARSIWSGSPKGEPRKDQRGIGCDLGGSGLLAIDLDSAQGIDDWLSGPFGMLRTLAVKTGRGAGLHLYYRQDPEYPLIPSVSKRSLARVHGTVDAEIKGCGGYTVLPPTLHLSGRRYELLDDPPVLPLPAELRDWIHAAGGRGRVVRSREGGDGSVVRAPQAYARWALDQLSTARPDTRNDACRDAALMLADVVDTGWCTADEARGWFFDACSEQPSSVLVDELDKTIELWERLGPA